jgi:hypothetical protein
MTTDDFCFYLQNRVIQTSLTGGQWYSDPSPFSIPWARYCMPSVAGPNAFSSSERERKGSGLYYKCFTIVMYNHNDSGWYYKTTITIVIDDPS